MKDASAVMDCELCPASMRLSELSADGDEWKPELKTPNAPQISCCSAGKNIIKSVTDGRHHANVDWWWWSGAFWEQPAAFRCLTRSNSLNNWTDLGRIGPRRSVESTCCSSAEAGRSDDAMTCSGINYSRDPGWNKVLLSIFSGGSHRGQVFFHYVCTSDLVSAVHIKVSNLLSKHFNPEKTTFKPFKSALTFPQRSLVVLKVYFC